MKNTNLFYFLAFILLVLASCNSSSELTKDGSMLYQSEGGEFSIYEDRVLQGDNEAKVLSPTEMASNYKSLESEIFPRRIEFKFSLNQKDNELPVGENHVVVIQEERESPVITFGQPFEPKDEDPSDPYLPKNYRYTFRVDLSPVLKSFEEKGYYECVDGSRVAKSDFKGVYIAGSAEPLTWDFVNLESQGLRLRDQDQDGIYTLSVTLNPFDPADAQEKSWKLSQDISMKPQYHSDQPLVDALFNMSLEEAILNIEDDSTLRTGAKWGGVWTRDVSYSILLAFAYHEPEVAKISLLRKVNRNRIIQDTGSGGAWPVSSDRTTWALAAWELYKVTGDRQWLSDAFSIIQNSLADDAKTLPAPSGLYRGESSFLDWREQTYPKWMSNKDIYVSENLGTNVVHYQAHKILGMMAEELGVESQPYFDKANALKEAINEHLWMPGKGYYGQYRYGRKHLSLSPRFEALGEALAILFEVADEEKAEQIISQSPVTTFGTTCIYPQIPDIPPYHNNGIWPFVQSYWNWAAAKAGNEAVLEHGLAAIYRAGGLFLTNYENFVADNGDYMGTEVNSHRMLWSMAGNLAMVHRVFMGMNFEQDGIRFQPVIPESYAGKRSLSNFKYRDMLLEIRVEGYGNEIASIKLDGQELDEPFLSKDFSGAHIIEIKMKNRFSTESGTKESEGINLVENRFSPPAPQLQLADNTLQWKPIEGVSGYEVFRNGEMQETVSNTQYALPAPAEFAEYQVRAVDSEGIASFLSEPIRHHAPERELIVQAEQFAPSAPHPYTNFTGRSFIEISTEENRTVISKINVEKAGDYLIDVRYSNGTGPWNTDNNCGIRSVYVNGDYQGVWVFPQRGTDEWSDWGYSNAQTVSLRKGENDLRLSFKNWNINMDEEINTAMLDHIRVVRL